MTSPERTAAPNAWPALPLADWQPTCATLQLLTQIVGKTRLALMPMANHWWQVALYLSARGLTTSLMPIGNGRGLEIEFDFPDSRLMLRTTDGADRTIALAPRPVADFFTEYSAVLKSLGVAASIWPRPSEVADPIPFDDDRVHVAYDADAVRRWWGVMLQVDRVLTAFRSRFLGKSSPVHLWWGSFDIACTRFSGRRAPIHPGGIPNLPDRVTREAYSHECISAGWWPGGGAIQEPAFYAYAYPEPAGCPEAVVQPAAARYELSMREWILPYDAVRTAADPDAAALDFFQSTYEAAADRGGWDRATCERLQLTPPSS